MKWEKTNFKFTLSDYSSEYQGAAVPFGIMMDSDVCRIYYTARDRENRSNIFYMDMNIMTMETIDVPCQPILKPGQLGCFDDSGAMTSWIERVNDQYWLYYIGWNLGQTVPFRNSIGLAVSEDGTHFCRKFDGPIMDRIMSEPHFCASTCVRKERDIWKMWYLSCVKWIRDNSLVKHYYHIKYAESHDGINWKRDGIVCIDFKDEMEYAISRPCVLKINDKYRMWYSYRGDRYRIGYAESCDGINWTRKDEKVGIDISKIGFDSDMVCYPHVILHNGQYYMLYNGNGYGKTGFGLAKLIESEFMR